MSSFYWRLCFEDVLLPSEKGLVVVVHNDCQQAFTYQVDGESATYLGRSDLHDKSLDDSAVSFKLSKDMLPHNSVGLNAFFDEDYCPYMLSLYPSQKMKKEYVNRGPILSSFLVVLVFSFACAIFFSYDFLVERRQKVVMDQAMQSTAIVSSLFPEAVRDRLFNDGGAEGEGEHTNGNRASIPGTNHFMNGDSEDNYDIDPYGVPSQSFEPAAKTRLKSFLTDAEALGGGTPGHKPIADLFPHCTVLFADIAGFTAWSSLREPTQVFTLLENIYHSFDQ